MLAGGTEVVDAENDCSVAVVINGGPLSVASVEVGVMCSKNVGFAISARSIWVLMTPALVVGIRARFTRLDQFALPQNKFVKLMSVRTFVTHCGRPESVLR